MSSIIDQIREDLRKIYESFPTPVWTNVTAEEIDGIVYIKSDGKVVAWCSPTVFEKLMEKL